jgi:hypothetical protein
MIAKSLSALLSAITLSAVFTINQRSSLENYSFEFVFLMGCVILAAIYLIVGIPLSILADRIVYKRSRLFVLRVGLYFLFGVGLCLLFILFRQSITSVSLSSNFIVLLILFGLSGVVFAIYEFLVNAVVKLLKRARNRDI